MGIDAIRRIFKMWKLGADHYKRVLQLAADEEVQHSCVGRVLTSEPDAAQVGHSTRSPSRVVEVSQKVCLFALTTQERAVFGMVGHTIAEPLCFARGEITVADHGAYPQHRLVGDDGQYESCKRVRLERVNGGAGFELLIPASSAERLLSWGGPSH